jgi:site-specific recombinase XerD
MTTQLATTDQVAIATTTAQDLDQNPAAVYLAGLGKSSRRTMRRALDAIAGLVSSGQVDALAMNWAGLRFQHTTAIRSRLAETYKPATANRYLSALRGVLKAAWRLGQMSAEDYRRAADVGTVKGETLPAGRSVSPGELSALMDACALDQSPAGVRDAAMIALLYSCGLRRSELVGLDVDDYDVEAGTLAVRCKGEGTGPKGGKERLAHVVDGAAAALADWLLLRGNDQGPLFWPIRKGGHLRCGRLTAQAVYYILKARVAQAGVADLSPHDFRRTFVGDLLDAGADIATVQQPAGHANVTTTARYDRRPEEARRKAARLLHVPYRRRTLQGMDGEIFPGKSLVQL